MSYTARYFGVDQGKARFTAMMRTGVWFLAWIVNNPHEL